MSATYHVVLHVRPHQAPASRLWPRRALLDGHDTDADDGIPGSFPEPEAATADCNEAKRESPDAWSSTCQGSDISRREGLHGLRTWTGRTLKERTKVGGDGQAVMYVIGSSHGQEDKPASLCQASSAGASAQTHTPLEEPKTDGGGDKQAVMYVIEPSRGQQGKTASLCQAGSAGAAAQTRLHETGAVRKRRRKEGEG